MTTLKMIGLGMATLDILARMGPAWQPGSPVDELILDGGGMACNAASAAQRLGLPAGFVGTYGSDRLGQLKLQLLRESGVDASRMVATGAPEDQVVLVQVDAASGERIFHPLAALWRPPRRDLDPAELDRAYLASADFLLVDGFHPQAGLQAARWMRAAGKRVMLDANISHGPPSGSIRALVAETDFLVVSAGFCQALTGLDERRAALAAAHALGPGVVVQTEGPGGSYTHTRAGDFFHTPAFPVQAVDTTGAGDVFHGAYLAGLSWGWDLRRVAAFASTAAALKCRKLGRAGFPTRAEVEEFVSLHQ